MYVIFPFSILPSLMESKYIYKETSINVCLFGFVDVCICGWMSGPIGI